VYCDREAIIELARYALARFEPEPDANPEVSEAP